MIYPAAMATAVEARGVGAVLERALGGERITEFTCAGIRCELWSGAAPGDPNVDRSRYRLNVSGAGLIEIDPPGAADRTVTLRAIDATAGRPLDTWQPLVLPFKPA